jgi:cardiolipin synthase
VVGGLPDATRSRRRRGRPGLTSPGIGVRVAVVALVVVVLGGCGAAGTDVSSPTTLPGPPATSGATRTTATTAGPAPRNKAVKPSGRSVATSGGALTLFRLPDQGIAPVDAFLSSPRHTLDMTMYELADSTAEGILAADAARGVVVRVVLDHNREARANTPAYDFLAGHGVAVRWAPAAYEATHAKDVVVDAGRSGARALVMTLNLTSRYYATTRDFAVVDTDAGDVTAIETVFRADDAGRPVTTPGGADLVWSPGSQGALVALIDSARSTLVVENEEMGDTAVTGALERAGRRGVHVEVTMTAASEWAQAFGGLTAAGVHVHLYPDTGSGLYIHAKAIVADGRSAFVGSENFSPASLDDNRELGIITSERALVGPLAATLSADYAGAPVTGGSAPTGSPPGTAPAVTSSASCHPLSDEGRCYRAGEYCRVDDHGAGGVAADGQPITCERTGRVWEWEPS